MIEKNNLREEAALLAGQLFQDNAGKRESFTNRLVETCELVKDKDILVIHNPGGWGSTRLDHLLQWERSIVEGVSNTIGELGFSYTLMQYFRSNTGWIAIAGDIREQTRFFYNKAKIMAAELEFITSHFKNLQVVMIGVSQGAAFSNAVTQNLNGLNQVASIELGTPFFHKSKTVISEITLSLESNGLMPDALMEWNIPTIFKTYLSAPFRWLKRKMQGKQVKFTYCINLPGHDYNWDYPEVQRQIEEFIELRFGKKTSMEVEA